MGLYPVHVLFCYRSVGETVSEIMCRMYRPTVGLDANERKQSSSLKFENSVYFLKFHLQCTITIYNNKTDQLNVMK